MNETLDRLVMHGMDCTVCVSAAQALKVRRAGVPSSRIRVIRNAVMTEPFDKPDPEYRTKLRDFFAWQPTAFIGAVGRLSPEKGFDQFIDAAALVHEKHPAAGFVLFGDGPLREALAKRIAERKLDGVFILAGFRTDVARFLPFLDVSVLSSHTEGLPNVVMEAMAARVPVVATAVGGTPEVVADGVTGWLVPPRNVAALATRIGELLADEGVRRRMGDAARRRIEDEFTFARVSEQYLELFDRLAERRNGRRFYEASLIGDVGVMG
jgi:glycosyltransferase involved in cell wall biosynthesis